MSDRSEEHVQFLALQALRAFVDGMGHELLAGRVLESGEAKLVTLRGSWFRVLLVPDFLVLEDEANGRESIPAHVELVQEATGRVVYCWILEPAALDE